MNDNLQDRFYLYGLDDEYYVIRYEYILREDLTISGLKSIASSMRRQYPTIRNVFAVTNSYGVYESCREAMMTKLLESRVLFKIMLETYGIEIN